MAQHHNINAVSTATNNNNKGGHQQASPLTAVANEPAPAKTIAERGRCVYTACYCEENVWQLCHQIMAPPKLGDDDYGVQPDPKLLDAYYVVFISNLNKTVLLFQQKAGHPPDGRCIWDYHVILVGKLMNPTTKKSLVYDLDTMLDFPCSIDTYFEEAIKPDLKMPKLYRRTYRVIPAHQFYTEFASDRRHMLRPDGTWNSPPPSYEPIKGENAMVEFNLDRFIDMTTHDNEPQQFGIVLNDSYQFLTFFSKSC